MSRTDSALRALLMLRRGSDIQVGASRIDLLRRIAELGSISAAAKAAGLSYKGAWDAVQALNNLSARPLVTAQPGGSRGGTAEVTAEGRALIEAFGRIDNLLATYAAGLDDILAGSGLSSTDLIRSLSMKTSARNAFSGTVTEVRDGAVNAEVILDLGGGIELAAVITRDSVEALGLAPGRTAIALIKSSFVLLAAGHERLPISARNRLLGVVSAVTEGAVNDEVTLQLDGGKTVTAVVTQGSRRDLGLEVGVAAQALVKASHIILATD